MKDTFVVFFRENHVTFEIFTVQIPKGFNWELGRSRMEYLKNMENVNGETPKTLTFHPQCNPIIGAQYDWKCVHTCLEIISDMKDFSSISRRNIEDVLHFAEYTQCDFLFDKLYYSHIHRQESIMQLYKFAKFNNNPHHKKYLETCIFFIEVEKGLILKDLDFILNPYIRGHINRITAQEKLNRVIQEKERLWSNRRADVKCPFCEEIIQYGSVVNIEKFLCCDDLSHKQCDNVRNEMTKLRYCEINFKLERTDSEWNDLTVNLEKQDQAPIRDPWDGTAWD